MFTLAKDPEIGKHLRGLIKSLYPNRQDFIRACLEAQGESVNETNVQNMANKLIQIFNGNNQIQVLDLPLFADVLHVSLEYILSAGRDKGPDEFRMTNASVAKSTDPNIWTKYLRTHTERDVDEYGKTLVEYAMDYKNHELIHYLVDTGHITFWGETEAGRQCHGLGAVMDCWGLSEDNLGWGNVSYRLYRDLVELRLVDDPALCEGLMRLAIEANDIELLREMRAREGEAQKRLCEAWSFGECDEVNRTLVDAIAAADEGVISYFAEEYTLVNRFGNPERWLSPFFEPLLQRLLGKDHPMAEQMLKTAEAHNQYACDRLRQLFAGDQKNFSECLFRDKEGRKNIRKGILKTRSFSAAGDMVLYVDAVNRGMLSTNLIRVDETMATEAMKPLAVRVNSLYHKVRMLQPVVTGPQEV